MNEAADTAARRPRMQPCTHQPATVTVPLRRMFCLAAVMGLPAVLVGGSAWAQPRKPRDPTIAVLLDSLNSEFWIAGLKILKLEFARRGFRTVEAVSGQNDDRQHEQVLEMIRRRVDGIVIVQTDARAVSRSILAANRAGIPMVHFNRAAARSDGYSVSVTADNRAIAREAVDAGAKLAAAAGGARKAAILLGHMGDPNAAERRDGFLQAMADYPHIEIVARVPTDWDADKAAIGLAGALRRDPDIDFLFTSSDLMIPAVRQVLQGVDKWHPSGHPRHVTYVGFDGFPEAYTLLRTGYMDACGVQNLFLEVRLAIDAIDDLLAGNRPPQRLVDPGFVITRASLNQQRAQMWGYLLQQERS